MKTLSDLKVKIFADGADVESFKKLSKLSHIKGFTTNPTLMRQSGIKHYESFAKELLKEIINKPISFEVFSDTFPEMERQAHKISSWGKNVFVKIPISNTKGESSIPLIERLSNQGLSLNVTAITTLNQVSAVTGVLSPRVSSIVSIFAGRIADTGRDPVPMMKEAVGILKNNERAEVLWASPRELLNLFQAEVSGCHIITLADSVLKKIPMIGKELEHVSLDTVKMFFNDAQLSGFSL